MCGKKQTSELNRSTWMRKNVVYCFEATLFFYAVIKNKRNFNPLGLQVKEIIKVVKHWRNCIQWKKTAYRPNSYLLSLLVIKAAEDTRS